VFAVDDEGVDDDLGMAENERERVQAQDGEADGHLTLIVLRRHRGAGKDGEDDPVTGVLEQSAESGRRGVQPGVAGEDVLRVCVGAVLAHERQDGRQVARPRRARDDARSRTGS
jgi:hypothetical protein